MSPREAEKRRFASRARVGSVVPVARAFACDAVTPVAMFSSMRRSGQECFLLESVEGGEATGRYTFLGCGPIARFEISGGTWRVEEGWHGERLEEKPLAALERLVVRPGFVPDPDLPPLSGGAVGFLGYDAVRLFEAIPDRHPREGKIPDGLFLLFDAAVAFDHVRQRLLLVTELDVKRAGDEECEAEAASARLDRLEAFLVAEPQGAPRPLPAEPGAAFDSDGWRPLLSREEFLASVERAKEAIFAGDIYQVVLSQRWTAPLAADPFDVYRALRIVNPSPYLFYLETREATLFGASPEMLVRCRGREVETRPIAGTAPRGSAVGEDEELARALSADPKERAEHVMLVDLTRNDLGRVCEIGSVRVSRYADVEKYSHVQHLVSEVRGRLARGRTAVDALAACFPAGTLTGAPKIRAMELIDRWEGARRGVYGGAVGYLDHAGNLDMAIAIRTAVVEGELCRVQAGAGIVADSVPQKEYSEAESKAAALFRAIEIARSWSRTSAPDRRLSTVDRGLPS
jgi:anthranilate synthase component I